MACGVDTGIDAGPSDDIRVDPSQPVEVYVAADFRADYLRVTCDWYERCASTVGRIFPDRASCESLISFTLEAGFDSEASFNDPLLYRVDIPKARDCVSAVTTRSCQTTAPNFTEAACADAFIGRLNDGECCDDRGGCGAGLVCEEGNGGAGYCSREGGYGETCFRQTCVAGASCQNVDGEPVCLLSQQLTSGAICERTFDCAAGLSCQGVGGQTVSRCLLRPEVGEYCGLPERPCAAGLYCVGQPGFGSLCATQPGAENASCGEDRDCGAGLSCASGTCVHFGTSGEPCNDAMPNQRCIDELSCVNGTCGPVPVPVAVGDPCAPDGPDCPGVLGSGQCLLTAGGYVCVAPGTVNQPCGEESQAQCDFANGLACDPVSRTCQSLPAVGAACPNGLCQPLLSAVCVNGTCKQRVPLGAPCTPMGDEDPKEIFSTECAVFSACLPDPTSGATTCKREDFSSGSGACQ